ncbi:MAG: hypothetical protein AB7O98_11085 [Hyphomonadaceae bacterium]
MSPQPAAPRTAPIALWRIIDAFLRTVFSICGAPEELAARITLTTKVRAVLLPWIKTAEILMRQMLLVEAAACGDTHAPTAAQRKRLTPQRACVSPQANEAPSLDPATWRVSFQALAPTPRAPTHATPATRAAPARREAKRFHAAYPLAARLEALLRVFNDPRPFAQRLAQRLYRTPELIERLMPEPRPTHIARGDYHALCSAGDGAFRHFFSSC